MTDINGDGKVDKWEMNICHWCLLGMLALAFSNNLVEKGFV